MDFHYLKFLHLCGEQEVKRGDTSSLEFSFGARGISVDALYNMQTK